MPKTPREIELEMKPRCHSPMEAQALMDAREAFVSNLVQVGRVSPEDLMRLDRLGRFKVADECWAICDEQARDYLLNDAHHQVRAAALLSGRASSNAQPLG